MYIPKQSYFSSTRVQKLAKEVIKDAQQDRARALEAFDYFKKMVEANPDDAKSKAEMNKALQLSQDSNDKVVRILDMMLKMTQAEMKTIPATQTDTSITFESLRNNGKK
tara:strand:+ start:1840 stop:2166 length:327 start_codon:yes stop_codon:yes gene_type:complete